MTKKELAKKILGVIKQRGWTSGELQNSKGQVCLLGALNQVMRGNPYRSSNYWWCISNLEKGFINAFEPTPMEFNDTQGEKAVMKRLNEIVKGI